MKIIPDEIDKLVEFGHQGSLYWGERIYLAAEAIYNVTDADVAEVADVIGESLVAGA